MDCCVYSIYQDDKVTRDWNSYCARLKWGNQWELFY